MDEDDEEYDEEEEEVEEEDKEEEEEDDDTEESSSSPALSSAAGRSPLLARCRSLVAAWPSAGAGGGRGMAAATQHALTTGRQHQAPAMFNSSPCLAASPLTTSQRSLTPLPETK